MLPTEIWSWLFFIIFTLARLIYIPLLKTKLIIICIIMFVRREYSMSTVIGQSSVFLCTYIYRCCNHCCRVGIEKDIDLHTVSVPHTQNHMILEKKDTPRVNYRLVTSIIILRTFFRVIESSVLVNNKMFTF